MAEKTSMGETPSTAGKPSNLNHALDFLGRVIDGSFDPVLFNNVLGRYGEIVLHQQPDRPARADTSASSASPAHSSGPLIPPVDPRAQLSGPSTQSPAARWPSTPNPTDSHSSSPSNRSHSVADPSNDISDLEIQERKREEARTEFLRIWQPVVHERTNGRRTVDHLCEYHDLPPSLGTHSPDPYGELGALMAAVETWGSPQNKQILLSQLIAVSSVLMETDMPSLNIPQELRSFEQPMQVNLYNLWRAARLVDFWDQFKGIGKLVWRMSLFKEVRIFYGIRKLAAADGGDKTDLCRFYKAFNDSTSSASRLHHSLFSNSNAKKYRLSVKLPYFYYPYKTLTDHFHSDGIVAMIPADFSYDVFLSAKRREATVQILELLKPEFEDTDRLQGCSEYIDKLYEGNSLMKQDLEQLRQLLQSPSAVTEPSPSSGEPVDENPSAATKPFLSPDGTVYGRADGLAGGIDLLSPMPTNPSPPLGSRRLGAILPKPITTHSETAEINTPGSSAPGTSRSEGRLKPQTPSPFGSGPEKDDDPEEHPVSLISESDEDEDQDEHPRGKKRRLD
ncbi:MAG: hypothetical protein Q9168_004917 [Polycauliona sp. 1 TL-2023]